MPLRTTLGSSLALLLGLASDYIYGGDSKDTAYGMNGQAIIRGGPGDDVFYGGTEHDVCKSGTSSSGENFKNEVKVDCEEYRDEAPELVLSVINAFLQYVTGGLSPRINDPWPF